MHVNTLYLCCVFYIDTGMLPVELELYISKILACILILIFYICWV